MEEGGNPRGQDTQASWSALILHPTPARAHGGCAVTLAANPGGKPHPREKAKHLCAGECLCPEKGVWKSGNLGWRTDTAQLPCTHLQGAGAKCCSEDWPLQLAGGCSPCLKSHQRRLLLGIRTNFFMESVAKHWHELPLEVVQSPSLKVFKKPLYITLGAME